MAIKLEGKANSGGTFFAATLLMHNSLSIYLYNKVLEPEPVNSRYWIHKFEAKIKPDPISHGLSSITLYIIPMIPKIWYDFQNQM